MSEASSFGEGGKSRPVASPLPKFASLALFKFRPSLKGRVESNYAGKGSAFPRRKHQRAGIDGLSPLPNFEMQLRAGDIAGLPRKSNYVAAIHPVARRNQQALRMRVSGDVAVLVADQDQIAIALEAGGIGD